MKKFLILILVVLGIYYISNRNKEVINIPEDAIRLRVVANSNKDIDQIIKLKVRLNLQQTTTGLLKNVKTSKEAYKILNNNLSLIENNIDTLLTEENYKEDFQINLGKNYFPKKKYNNKIYESGYYDSLYITLGRGEGDNWWCVLFPPMCLLETDESRVDNPKYEFFLSSIFKSIFE